jgi:hypothetical protein
MVFNKTGNNFKNFLEQKGKKVLFICDKKSVEQTFLYKKIIDEGHCVIIPTSVDILFSLDKLKIPYKIPENYYTPEEYWEYAENLEPKIVNFSKEIDKVLGDFYPEIRQSGLKPAFYNLYSFVRILSPLIDSYFKIKQIIQKEKPGQIGLISSGEESIDTNASLEGWLLWGAKENIFHKVLNTYKTDLPISIFILDREKSAGTKEPGLGWKNMASWSQKNPQLYYFLKTFKKNKQLAIINFLCQFSGLTPLLLLNSGYDWEECHSQLYKEGYYIWGQINDNFGNWYHKKDSVKKNAENIIYKLEGSASFCKNFKEN